MAIDPRKFLLNTDYELDKIIFVSTGDFVGTKEIPHNLGFTPLVFGMWSEDSSFTTCNNFSWVETTPIAGYTPPLAVEIVAKDNKITLYAEGKDSGTKRIYYRVFAFAPPDANVNVPTTSNLANEFILNTDYNYRKLKATGEFTQGGQSYAHNLGYKPQVMAWFKYSANMGDRLKNSVQPLEFMSYATNLLFNVSENNISVPASFPFFLGSVRLIDKVMWRVYYDEA